MAGEKMKKNGIVFRSFRSFRFFNDYGLKVRSRCAWLTPGYSSELQTMGVGKNGIFCETVYFVEFVSQWQDGLSHLVESQNVFYL
jgi:hypothetical protein